MLDSGKDMTETSSEVTQPDATVAVNSEETGAAPQATETEQTELYVDVEGDQNKPNKNNFDDNEKLKAAFYKEKEKRQRKNEELERERLERERVQRELDELKSWKAKMEKGAPPTLESCDYDEDKYQEAVRNYYSSPQPTKTNEPEQPQNQPNKLANDEAEFNLYQQEVGIKKSFADYDQAKSDAIAKLQAGPQVVAQLQTIAHQTGIDLAKAFYAVSKVPGQSDALVKAWNTGNVFAVKDALNSAASLIKERQHKPIDTKPEPTISGGGPVDNASAQVAKAREDWVKNPTKANYQKYQAVKKKVNANG